MRKLAALMIGAGAALALAAALGESPLYVLELLLEGASGSATDRGYSLFYATPLILTGLSVAWAYKAGLFNIGAEGQMTMGGIAMAATGIFFPELPPFAAIPLALGAGFASGAGWAAIAGWMKAARGCHEVLATILLNFIAYGLSAFFILSVLKSPFSQAPETAPVGAGFRVGAIPGVGGSSPLNWTFLFALVAASIYAYVFARTRFGFVQRMTGGAPGAAARAGVNLGRETIKAMAISGGLAGVAAAPLVLGMAGKAREGFSAGAGFAGIAVALLGGGGALGVCLAAAFFGALAKGSLNFEIDADYITRDLAGVIQALVVLAVASERGLGDLASRARAWVLARKRGRA